jgi:hypothetical protein
MWIWDEILKHVSQRGHRRPRGGARSPFPEPPCTPDLPRDPKPPRPPGPGDSIWPDPKLRPPGKRPKR